MATLAEAGRIAMPDVEEEIGRLEGGWTTETDSPLQALLGEQLEQIDLFDRLQLENVVKVCLQSSSLSDAGRRLFGISRQEKAKANDADRLRKYLGRFGLEWKMVRQDGK
ncbi:hypothetical protein [Chitinimonas naiadis]